MPPTASVGSSAQTAVSHAQVGHAPRSRAPANHSLRCAVAVDLALPLAPSALPRAQPVGPTPSPASLSHLFALFALFAVSLTCPTHPHTSRTLYPRPHPLLHPHPQPHRHPLPHPLRYSLRHPVPHPLPRPWLRCALQCAFILARTRLHSLPPPPHSPLTPPRTIPPPP